MIPFSSPLARPTGPLYVEAVILLDERLTGLARFTARLVQALARLVPLRLTAMCRPRLRLASQLGLTPRLPVGWEILVDLDNLPSCDLDLGTWIKRVLSLPRQPFDREGSKRCPMLFPLRRPLFRHFRREMCILHDFTPLLIPWAHTGATRHEFGEFFAHGTLLCDKAFAVSESTRADAAWMAGIAAEDVICRPNGPSQCTYGHAHPQEEPRRRNLIAVVSTLEPRKNASFLCDWFLNTSLLDDDVELCWVGPRGWLGHLTRRGQMHKGRRRIRFPGVVSDAALCKLYREATFTIYPSLYEGFGFPVLDSLLHGAPVLCSLNSSLDEFAGPGVFYFDPCDLASVDEAYRELMAAQPMSIDSGSLRARFSWDRMAECIVAHAFASPDDALPAGHEPSSGRAEDESISSAVLAGL